MLAFRFKDKLKKTEYLFYIDKLNDSLVYHGFSVIDGKKCPLNKDILGEINSYLLINDSCVFFKKYKNYDIYYDNENDLYHYLENGKENLLMTLIANSKSAVMYKNRFNSFKNLKSGNYVEIVKKSFLLIGNITLIFAILATNLNFDNKEDIPNISYVQEAIVTQDSSDITVDFIKEKIMSSNRLTEGEKILLCNDELLSAVVPYYRDSSMKYMIGNRLDNYGIIYADLKDEQAGLYFGTNEIYLMSDFASVNIKDNYKSSVIGHEFIHTLQSDCYMYIKESSAEVISSEYFNRDEYSYEEACLNFKLLVETLGPEVMWEYIFSGDDTRFDSLLRDNLDKEDYDILISQLKLSPFSDNPDHDKVKEIIGNLYKNIYKKDIMDDRNIYDFYGNYIEKNYFKSSNESINRVISCDNNKAFELGIITYEDLYEYKKEINKDEYWNYLNEWNASFYYLDNNHDSYDISLSKDGNTILSYYDSNSKSIIVFENDEKKEYEFNKESIDKLAREYNFIYSVRTINKDYNIDFMSGGKIANIPVSKNPEYICQGIDVIYNVKSMSERFPDQIIKINNDNIKVV